MIKPNHHQPRYLAFCVFFVLTMICAGCAPKPDHRSTSDSETEQVTDLPPEPLTVQAVGSAELAQSIARQWSARRGGDLTIVDVTDAAFQNNPALIDPNADVLIYPPGMLGELAEAGALMELPYDVWNSPEINKPELLKHARTSLVSHDSRIWGVPLGSRTLQIVYRADLLQQAGLEVPETWEQFGKAVTALEKAELDVPQSSRLALPASSGWCAKLLLMRVAAAIRQRGKLSTVFDRDNMQPLIATQPFVMALADLQSWSQPYDWLQQENSPQQVYEQIAAGDAVLAITWPTASAFSGQSTEPNNGMAKADSAVTDAIAVAQVPGSEAWYDAASDRWMNRLADDQLHVDLIGVDGLIASVAAETRHASTAVDFIVWLTSKSTSVSLLAGHERLGPFRASHLGQPELWSGSLLTPAMASRYADIVREANESSVVFIFPRIPGYAEYLSVLDAAVRKCLSDGSEPSVALEAAATEWEQITDRIGRREQIASLRRSSGY